MPHRFASGALLGHVYTLEDGSAVRLRLARSSDARAIGELLERHGLDHGELDVARLVQFDPRRRYVLCATRLVASREVLLGVGTIALEAGSAAQPDLLIVDQAAADEPARLLRQALIGCATGVSRSRVA